MSNSSVRCLNEDYEKTLREVRSILAVRNTEMASLYFNVSYSRSLRYTLSYEVYTLVSTYGWLGRDSPLKTLDTDIISGCVE